MKSNDANQYYNYVDGHPNTTSNLYRIKMIEKNSSLSYSPVRQLNWGQKNDRFTLYPNPASQQVVATGDFSAVTTVKLFDASGKLKWNKRIVTNSDNVSFDVSSLQSGVYIIQIGEETQKLIVRK